MTPMPDMSVSILIKYSQSLWGTFFYSPTKLVDKIRFALGFTPFPKVQFVVDGKAFESEEPIIFTHFGIRTGFYVRSPFVEVPKGVHKVEVYSDTLEPSFQRVLHVYET